jgi:hypothetical protein
MFDLTVSDLAGLNLAAGGASGRRIGIQSCRNGQPRSGEGEDDDEFTHLKISLVLGCLLVNLRLTIAVYEDSGKKWLKV